MSEIEDGGAAFPCHTNPMPGKLENAPQGMTLRDYFAAAALQGIMINKELFFEQSHCATARCAYEAADAMLKARKEGA